MKIHRMKLQKRPFEKIKSGEKILEARLYDEKRRQIRLGDRIEFSELPALDEKISVTVAGLLIYKTFSDLFDDLPASYMGYCEDQKEWLKTSMYEIYSKEEEKENGVLGIRIELFK